MHDKLSFVSEKKQTIRSTFLKIRERTDYGASKKDSQQSSRRRRRGVSPPCCASDTKNSSPPEQQTTGWVRTGGGAGGGGGRVYARFVDCLCNLIVDVHASLSRRRAPFLFFMEALPTPALDAHFEFFHALHRIHILLFSCPLRQGVINTY